MVNLNNSTKAYSFKVDGKKYYCRIRNLHSGRFLVVPEIGHVGLDESYFVANSNFGICSPEYTRAHEILIAARRKIRALENAK